MGALAIDGRTLGTMWFESGRPGNGILTKVVDSNSVLLQPTGSSGGLQPKEAPSRPASAARLAPDGTGGVLLAEPSFVRQLTGKRTETGPEPPAGAVVAGTTKHRQEPRNVEPLIGDGGPLDAARFTNLIAITTDEAGNAFVVDEVDERSAAAAIRFLNRSAEAVTFYAGTAQQISIAPGTLDTVAGGIGGAKPLGDSRLSLRAPALAVVGELLYVAAAEPGPRSNATVSVINLGGAPVTAHGRTVRPGQRVSLSKVAGRSTDSPAGTGASWVSPVPALAADGQGNLYMVESDNHRVRRVDPAGGVSTFAGTGAPGFNGNDRPATTARLNRPFDVDVAPGGRVYISDSGNAQVRFVDQAGIVHAGLGNGASASWTCAAISGPDDGVAGRARTGRPSGLSVDQVGNVYVSSVSLRQVYRLGPSGTLTPVAGRPQRFCGEPSGCRMREGSPATGTDLDIPGAIARGPGDGLYVQDKSGVRLVNLGRQPLTAHGVEIEPGTVRTVAGGGSLGPGDVDGAPALAAAIAIRLPNGSLTREGRGGLLVVDAEPGNLFNGRILRVDDRGTISTLLRSPPDEPPAVTAATWRDQVAAVLVDAADNLYISSPHHVWFQNRSDAPVVVHGVKVAPGAVEVVAGRFSGGSGDEGIAATEAQLSQSPDSLALDRSGNLYVLDYGHDVVRRVDTEGTITTVVGTGQRGFNGDGLKGMLTALDRPVDITFDLCGNLLIADFGNDRVRRLNLVGSCRPAPPSPADAEGRASSSVIVAAAGLIGLVAAGWAVVAGLRRRGARRRTRSAARSTD